ncbi:ester cyclase [Carboxylicivirga marina]|uniref:ester cyclase n=1 Tax=Carboxylicivirga marina TaxID=2800988 RepID=UPI0025974101|nr:ester cyclase [uncultured Carboxylicivirga sp.]
METKHATKEETQLLEFQQLRAKEQRNVETIKKFFNIASNKEFDSWQNLCTEDFKLYMGSEKPISLDDVKPMAKMFYNAFPDYAYKIENCFASNDNVAMQLLFTGTHKGNFQEIPATNNKIEYKSIQIYKFEGDKIHELHEIEDALTMMTQIGLKLQ